MAQTTDTLTKAAEQISSSAGKMNITLDIAAVLGTLLWPIVILVLLLTYRHKIFDFIQTILPRINKVGIGVFSLEFAEAKQFTPEWSKQQDNIDLRTVSFYEWVYIIKIIKD